MSVSRANLRYVGSCWFMHKVSVFHWPAVAVLIAMACLLSGCNLGRGPYYCSSQQRNLSDEEFIAIAIHAQVTAELLALDASDASARNFLKEHPTCCGVTRDFEEQSFIYRMTHVPTVEVEVNFRVKEDARKRNGDYYEDHLFIDSCGTVLDRYGTGVDVLKQIDNGV